MLLRSSLYALSLGISLSTLYRWLKSGKIHEPERTFGNHKRFQTISNKRKTAIYARVSSSGQKEDLERQIQVLKKYTENIEDVIIIKDIGSGINFQKPGFKQLMSMILNKELSTIVIQNKDRLSRFGIGLITLIADLHGTKIEIKEKSINTFEANLVEDLMALIASFSGAIYGKRSHKNLQAVK